MNPARFSRRSKMLLCFTIVYLVWGSTYLVTAIGVRATTPFLFGAFRFMSGGVLLFIVARSLSSYRQPTTRAQWLIEWRQLMIVGSCAVLISNGCNGWGLQYVPSNQAALLNATVAFWITLFGMFGARAHSPSVRGWIGLGIGLVGTALILLPRGAPSVAPESPYGPLIPQLVILCGCMAWSLGTVLQRKASIGFDLLSFTALQQIFGGLMLLAVGLASGEPAQWRWSASAVGALAYMIVMSSCIAYTAYAWLSQNATPSQIGTYALVNPTVATLLGWYVLGEDLVAAQWLGMIIILTGVMLVNWPRSKAATLDA